MGWQSCTTLNAWHVNLRRTANCILSSLTLAQNPAKTEESHSVAESDLLRCRSETSTIFRLSILLLAEITRLLLAYLPQTAIHKHILMTASEPDSQPPGGLYRSAMCTFRCVSIATIFAQMQAYHRSRMTGRRSKQARRGLVSMGEKSFSLRGKRFYLTCPFSLL